MNVLQAIEKIKELEIKLQALKSVELAESMLAEVGFKKEHMGAVSDLKKEVVKELNEMESRLEKTQLSVVR